MKTAPEIFHEMLFDEFVKNNEMKNKIYTTDDFKKWGSKGGKKRMASLSAKQRKELAQLALKGRGLEPKKIINNG